MRGAKRSNQTLRDEIHAGDRRFYCWFRPLFYLVPSFSERLIREPIRDNPKIVFELRKHIQIATFFGNHFWTIYEILNTITILNEIIESTSNFVQTWDLFDLYILYSKRSCTLFLRFSAILDWQITGKTSDTGWLLVQVTRDCIFSGFVDDSWIYKVLSEL